MTKVLCKITCILALIFNVRLAVAQAGDLPHSTPHQPAVIKAPAMPHPGPVAAAAIQAIAGHVPAAKPNVLSIVHQQIMIHGHPLHYTITSGYMPMTNRSGKLLARIFFIAYTKDVVAGRQAARPLTFAFNGGPGAAAVWLNLGCAGPTRLVLTPQGKVPPPPYRLAPNHQTWLTATDLVFVDPVGTGYSRAAPGVAASRFFGVMPDIQSIGSFIRRYMTAYQRWGSPVFLAGESYGTTRAAALTDYLSSHEGLDLNGVILISSVLNFETLEPSAGNDVPYPLYLPSYTATAWYHHKLPPDLEAHFHRTLAKVERWALHVYMPALAEGNTLSQARRATIAAKLARYTGLPEKFILLSNLRINPFAFEQRLLRSQRLVVSRMDTRLTGYNPDPTAGMAPYDPGLSRYVAPFTSAFNWYVRRDLHYTNNLRYKTLANLPWKFNTRGNGYLNVADNLQRGMIRDPDMKVLVCSGYFDLATPFFATIYTMDHLNLSPRLAANIKEVFFRGGHMVYHPAPMRRKLAQEVRAFIAASSGRGHSSGKGSAMPNSSRAGPKTQK